MLACPVSNKFKVKLIVLLGCFDNDWYKSATKINVTQWRLHKYVNR